MPIEYSRLTDSGLILAEDSMDSAAVDRALKKKDPLLSLQGWPSATHDCILWKVVRYAGPDRPPDTVAVWQSDRGEPFPLSSGLLDLVDKLDRNTRYEYLNEDQREQRRREQVEKEIRQRDADLIDDWTPRHGRPVLPRSQSLRMARDKRRGRGEKC